MAVVINCRCKLVMFGLRRRLILIYTVGKTKSKFYLTAPTLWGVAITGGYDMARRNRDDDLLLEEDELTAAFFGRR